MELTAEFRAKVLAKVLGARVHDCGAGWHYALDSDPELHQGWIDVPEGNAYRCALEDALLTKGYSVQYWPLDGEVQVILQRAEGRDDTSWIGDDKDPLIALTLAAARAMGMDVPE